MPRTTKTRGKRASAGHAANKATRRCSSLGRELFRRLLGNVHNLGKCKARAARQPARYGCRRAFGSMSGYPRQAEHQLLLVLRWWCQPKPIGELFQPLRDICRHGQDISAATKLGLETNTSPAGQSVPGLFLPLAGLGNALLAAIGLALRIRLARGRSSRAPLQRRHLLGELGTHEGRQLRA
jgi:hypothetical protein